MIKTTLPAILRPIYALILLIVTLATNAQSSDPHSYANFDQVRVAHINLNLDVDFTAKRLHGTAELSLDWQTTTATSLILDTRDLSIYGVSANGTPLDYRLAKSDKNLGRKLTIEANHQIDKVTILYATSPDASGLQWLTPQQTTDKKHPFLFSQAQAIHARSFIPLQDSPTVRVTYDATITTPKNLVAVMSANNNANAPRNGVYQFKMPQAIPSYLIALAVGDLQFKAIGKDTGVYAEPSVLDAAVAEFEDTQAMLDLTEKMYGKYPWERYDLLILPSSFPFGGMENPRLSFITPTVIAGDKSLVALIAHELAHSWSGNTVTNSSWRDLWLNEGFTTYLTYRIMENIYGENRFNMEALLGYQDLHADLAALTPADQRLAIDLTGRDPDDVFSNIPYEKGALFIRELEQQVGRANFDKFLMAYFAHFEFKSIDTETFVEYIKAHLVTPYDLDLNRILQWIHKPGLPDNHPVPTSDAFNRVDAASLQWQQGELKAKQLPVSSWTVHQWLHFLNNLPQQLSLTQLDELDQAFSLTQSKNNEIAHSWLMIAVRHQYHPAYPRLENYLMTIGRNKLVKPLYRELATTKDGKAFGQRVFEQAKAGYHPLTVKANEGYFQ